MADFPSTWDELTIELQCAAHDRAGGTPRCAGHDFFAAASGAAATRGPAFSPFENKRVFYDAVVASCGIF